jgi:glucose/arabinose dehydrogenase
MVVHPETGEIWQNEHGPRGGDEVNVVRAGANYGWPQYRFGTHYDRRPIPDPRPNVGIEVPIHQWTPALAPSGMTIYTGDVFPQWRGDTFHGDSPRNTSTACASTTRHRSSRKGCWRTTASASATYAPARTG